MIPTNELKFVYRNSKKILQQKWIMESSLSCRGTEWVDVPCEQETPKNWDDDEKLTDIREQVCDELIQEIKNRIGKYGHCPTDYFELIEIIREIRDKERS